MKNGEVIKQASGQLQTNDPEYMRLVTQISDLWENAKNKAAIAVNTELLDANWQTGQYIVEFEQGGNAKAKYGDKLLVNLSKDLTRLKGRGFSRSNLNYMRKLYLAFPICETLSHKLTAGQVTGNCPAIIQRNWQPHRGVETKRGSSPFFIIFGCPMLHHCV